MTDTRVHAKKIDTPDYVAIGPDGEPAWIKMKTRIKGKYRKSLAHYGQLSINATTNAKAVEQALSSSNGAIEKLDIKTMATEAAELIRYDNEIIPALFSKLVVEWNWTDEDDHILPVTQEVFQNELDQVQITWFSEQINAVLRYRGTEGNVPSATS